MQEVAVQPERVRDLRRVRHEGLQRRPTETRGPNPRNRRNHFGTQRSAHRSHTEGLAPDPAGPDENIIFFKKNLSLKCLRAF